MTLLLLQSLACQGGMRVGLLYFILLIFNSLNRNKLIEYD